jgi:hypothetical protein
MERLLNTLPNLITYDYKEIYLANPKTYINFAIKSKINNNLFVHRDLPMEGDVILI